jgi:5-epi-alpha-selinene synthase
MVASTQEYFEACVWEAANRQRGLTPNVDSYMDMRRCAGGMYIYADFIELVARAELPLVARRQMDVRRLVQIACNVSCWHNDLFSLEKEVARGDVHNLAVVLARQHGLGLREGRAMAVDHCNREVAEFLPIARGLPSYGPEVDPHLASYQMGLGSLMRGNLDWSHTTDRYRSTRRA